MLDVKDMIANATLKYIHKILTNKTPAGIFKYYRKNGRDTTHTTTIYKPKSDYTKKHIIYLGIKMYNRLPNDIKTLPIKRFAKSVKQHVTTHNMWDSAD